MNKFFIILSLIFLTASPSFSYSYCYKTSNKQVICREYINNYNRYNYPTRRNRYYYPPYGGGTTTVKYNAGFPVSVQRGFGPAQNINTINNNYPNSGAAFVFK